jgi:hypothetical protein
MQNGASDSRTLPIVVTWDVKALVLGPVAAVAVRVLEAEMVVVAELVGQDVVCNIRLALIVRNRRDGHIGLHIPSSIHSGRL